MSPHPRVAGMALACAALASAMAQRAWAEEPRSRGLVGEHAQRDITEPRNAMVAIVGPLQPQLFGLRYGTGVVDGGVQYARTEAGGASQSSFYASAGVGFGLFDDLEAGALFLRFELSPDFAYDDVNVFITRQFRLPGFDAAVRLSFRTPTRTAWALAPSVPVLVRLGADARLDTGAFFTFDLGDVKQQGMNLPLRVSLNATPHWFFGAQTGLFEPDFGSPNDISVPAGAFAGYTLLAGARVVDVTFSFDWDSLWWVDPAAGVDAFQPGTFRIVLGLSLRSSVL